MITAALMSRDHVSERRALVKHVVPGEREIAWRLFRPIAQREVRHHPRSKLELRDVRRRVIAIRPYHVTRHELRRSEDYSARWKTARIASLSIHGDHFNAAIRSRNQLNRRAIELHTRFRFLEQMIDETSVAFGPRDQR